MTDRVICLVPHCRRTTGKEVGVEWICAKHWALTDRRRRVQYFRCKRVYERQPSRRKTAQKVGYRVWQEIKKQAIERAAGIS